MSLIKGLIIAGLFATASWSCACFTAEEKVTSRNDNIAERTAPSPSATVAPLSVARFREQPDVLERLNRIFNTSDRVARTEGAEALGIDRDHASKLVVCDDGLFWRVVDTKHLREVRLDKDAGQLESKVITLSSTPVERSDSPSPMSKDEAIALAGEHFVKEASQRFNVSANIIDGYFPSLCDLGSYWRILFISRSLQNIARPTDIANLPNDHPPKYLIDKKNGDIIATP